MTQEESRVFNPPQLTHAVQMMQEDDSQATNKKLIPEDLMDDIKDAMEDLGSFAKKWARILEKGKEYGFKEQDMQLIAEPFLKEKLTRKQVYYLFHQEQEKERQRQVRQKKSAAVLRQIDTKKPLEQSDSPSPIEIPDDLPESTIDEPILNQEERQEMEQIAAKYEPEKAGPINMSDDAKFLAKRLDKALDDIHKLELQLEDKVRRIAQLEEALKKQSFKSATEMPKEEVDNVNTMQEFPVALLDVEATRKELTRHLNLAKGNGWKVIGVILKNRDKGVIPERR